MAWVWARGWDTVFTGVNSPNLGASGGRSKSFRISFATLGRAGTDTGVVVPRSAVFDKDGRTIVFVHTSPERFTARAVELAPGPGERVAILSGLAPGDRVVVNGGYQLLSSPVAGATR